MPSEPQSEPLEAGEKQLCTRCMFPNDPSANFCAKCGAPLTSFAATTPFERIFAEGHAYRQATENPQKLVVVLGVWLIFGCVTLVGITFLAVGFQMSRGLGFILVPICLGLIALSVVMLWKTTRNYLAKKRQTTPDNDTQP